MSPIKELYCERTKCPTEEYEARAFRECLYWHARLLEPFVRRLSPEFFEADLEFIRDLGTTTGARGADVELLNFRHLNMGNPSFFRAGLKLRVSGRKASRLVSGLFAAKREMVECRA